MKKFFFFALVVMAIVAAVFVAAPVLAGAALLLKGIILLSNSVGLPTWVAILIACTVAPSALFWLFQIFRPKVRRRLAAILIIATVLYGVITAALANQHLAACAFSASAVIQRLVAPLKPADPAEAWFYPDGNPRLFYARSSTNSLAFYRNARPGDTDPNTGLKLEPVSPELRLEWQAAKTREHDEEQARAEKSEKLALEAHRMELESLADSLHKQNLDLQNQRQSVLTGLLQQLETHQQKLIEAQSKLPSLPFQASSDAAQELAVARAMLLATMTNDSSADLTAVQTEFQAAVAKADQAEEKIQTASIQEAAKLAMVVEAKAHAELEEKERQKKGRMQKLADERQQAAANASDYRFRQPRVKLPKFRMAEDSVATVSIENTTRWRINVSFWSRLNHVWPAPGWSYFVEPGQTQTYTLSGSRGEEIFFDATSAENPRRWGSCSCEADGQLVPIAVIGSGQPVAVQRLVEY